MANQVFMELCNKVYTHTATNDEVGEFKSALKLIKDKGASPQAIWELNQILVKQAEVIIAPKLDFLQYVADVITVGHGEKIEFTVPKGKINMKWTARGNGVDYVRFGYSEKYTAEPVKIAGGVYYEYDQLLSGSTAGFNGAVDGLVEDVENKVTAKVLSVLHTKMASSPAVNRSTESGLTLGNFDKVTGAIQRYSPKVATVCDIDFAKKITGLVTDALKSDAMKDFKNTNRYFTTVNGVDVVVFANPYTDQTNTALVAPRRYGYVLPTGASNLKPVKIGFEGGMYQLTQQDIETERVFLKVGQKISVDMFDTYYTGEMEDTQLA